MDKYSGIGMDMISTYRSLRRRLSMCQVHCNMRFQNPLTLCSILRYLYNAHTCDEKFGTMNYNRDFSACRILQQQSAESNPTLKINFWNFFTFMRNLSTKLITAFCWFVLKFLECHFVTDRRDGMFFDMFST